MEKNRNRCEWCDDDSQLYVAYHDTEWGVPVTDERQLFEMLILEGMQAGLSWITILKKRQAFIAAFDNFNYIKVSQYDEQKTAELLTNKSIVRNKLKINAAVKNAKVFIELQAEFGSFGRYLWDYVNFKPIQNAYVNLVAIPAKTALSEKISKDLKRRGMNFVGPTIIYAFMEAIGMVNDHEISCHRYAVCKALAEDFSERTLL